MKNRSKKVFFPFVSLDTAGHKKKKVRGQERGKWKRDKTEEAQIREREV